MEPDTEIGGALKKFPATNHSAIVGARSEDQQVRLRAFDTILANYWKPAYKYIRVKWQANNEDAKDLTQGFFANAFEKNHFANYDASKASFRTFLRTCLDGFIANQRKSDNRLKRGGGSNQFSLDFIAAEDEVALQSAQSDHTPEEYFHREWIRSLFAQAVNKLRQRCNESGRTVHFQLFESYDLADDDGEVKLSYASLATRFGLDATKVNNYLAATRRDFRRIVLDELRQITATDEEFRNEARALLGVDVG